MKVIADLCVVPIGIGVSVSKEVAICERILAAAGLKIHLHAYGTNIEGDWDRVFAAVKQCHEALHAAGRKRALDDYSSSGRHLNYICGSPGKCDYINACDTDGIVSWRK